jgi:hypothetical protein
MKTLKQFEKQQELSYDEFLKPMDRIDEDFFHHIACGYVASNYDSGNENGVFYSQAGECNREDEAGTRFYETVFSANGKFYYLGEMPSMNKNVYRCEECHSYL